MRIFQAASTAIAAFAIVRGLALFLESYSAERAEHSGDEELARLCSEGQAPTSLRMRATCLDLIRARATPLFLKAALRATNVAYDEFASSLLSPRSLVAVFLFALMSVATPLLRLVRFAYSSRRASFDDVRAFDEEEESGTQRIVYIGDLAHTMQPSNYWGAVRKRFLPGQHKDSVVCNGTNVQEGWNEVQLSPRFTRLKEE